jgi:hypothetical protein
MNPREPSSYTPTADVDINRDAKSGLIILTDRRDALTGELPLPLSFHGNRIANLHPINLKPGKRRKEYRDSEQNAKDVAQKIGVDSLQLNSDHTLANTHYRDICFFEDTLSGLFVYPWINTPDHAKRSGSSAETRPAPSGKTATGKFKEFTMAHCLFGTSILGLDARGNKYPLIDHDLRVHSVIENIEVDDEHFHPYETTMFACLDQSASLIRSIAGKEFTIRYHLPIIDYTLYALHAYISGVMSFSAFEQYVSAIKQRGSLHKTVLENLAQKNNVTLHIESPFDNLLEGGPEAITANSLLNIISLTKEQVEAFKQGIKRLPEGEKRLKTLENIFKHNNFDFHNFGALILTLAVTDDLREDIKDAAPYYIPYTHDIRTLLESICIENILKNLRENDISPTYKKVWNVIISDKLVTSFSPLEELFKVANTTVIAAAQERHLRQPGAVCSLLPIDEKPIPLSYARSLATHFGSVYCLSWLPPVLSSVNYTPDLRSDKKSNTDNLFRLRTDKFALNADHFKRQLTEVLDLSSAFWLAVENPLASLVAEAGSDGSSTGIVEFWDKLASEAASLSTHHATQFSTVDTPPRRRHSAPDATTRDNPESDLTLPPAAAGVIDSGYATP